MRVTEMNWPMIEAYLRRDDRAVLPLGSTEQHGYLSLGTDLILAERVAVEAAEPLGVVVFPVVAYGITPYTLAYPGSVSLRTSTYLALVRDILDSLAGHGFRRLLLVNGHGGNRPVASLAAEWMADHPQVRVVVHDWWSAPETWRAAQAIDPVASHASWFENFPWNRVAETPEGGKPVADVDRLRTLPPRAIREELGDGCYGGAYRKSDEEMARLWKVAVEETRRRIDEL